MANTDGNRKANGGGPKTPPEIPDKLYFRIGEVARLLDLPPYVLRFWESEFPQLKPNKGGTGQRLYRRREVETAFEIRRLLYDEGYTIPGARQALKSEVRRKPLEPAAPVEVRKEADTTHAGRLRQMKSELNEIASLLARPLAPARQGSKLAHRGLHVAPRPAANDAPPPLFAVLKPRDDK